MYSISKHMPNANGHDAITYSLIPFTYLVADMYWGDHTVSAIATGAMLFSGLMFGPDLDLESRPYRRWGPLRFIWKPYQVALPHRSTFSHGPILGTIIRIIYFLFAFSLLAATILYFMHVYVDGQQSTWIREYQTVKRDLFEIWDDSQKQYLWGAFGGLWAGALAHTAADIIYSTYKKLFRQGHRKIAKQTRS